MRTVCSLCQANCGMLVKVRGGKVEQVTGDPAHPVNQGILCPKGSAVPELIYSRERLTHPLLKAHGGFKKISWNEALDIAADRLGEIREKNGPGALMRFAGAPVDYDVRDGFRQFMASYGSPNLGGAVNLCSTPRYVAVRSVLGSIPEPDYKGARRIIFWGANPMASSRYGNYLMEGEFGNFRSLIPEARRRGIKVYTIDPVYSETARISDRWISLEPGSDAALALSMIHVIIREKIYDQEFVQKWTEGFAALQDHVARLTPEWAEGITGISASMIRELAREYALSGPVAIRDGNGLDMNTNGVQTVRAIMFLIALTGNYDVPGGNAVFPSVQQAPSPQTKITIPEKRVGQDQLPLMPEIPSPALLDALADGSLKGMIVHHSNPLLILADTRRVKRTFERLKFLIVFDIVPTATAQMADLILPSTSFLERFGYRAYSNRQGGFLSLAQKVIEPLGESRSFPEVEYEIARRLGLAKGYPFTNNQEWVQYMLGPSGLTMDDLREEAAVLATPPVEYRKYLKSGFATPSGKVEFYSATFARNRYEPLPTYQEPLSLKNWESTLKERYPFKGINRRPHEYVLSTLRNLEALKKIYPAPLAMLHPEDALERDIQDGSKVMVESPNGTAQFQAKLTDKVRRGWIVVDFGWGNPWDRCEGTNVLTNSEVWDPVSGGTPNRLFICNIQKAKLDSSRR